MSFHPSEQTELNQYEALTKSIRSLGGIVMNLSILNSNNEPSYGKMMQLQNAICSLNQAFDLLCSVSGFQEKSSKILSNNEIFDIALNIFAEAFGVPAEILASNDRVNRPRKITTPRQYFIYFIRNNTTLTAKEIGEKLCEHKPYDHSTILHAANVASDMIATYPEEMELYLDISKRAKEKIKEYAAKSK